MNLVNQSIIKHKVGLLNLAEELKNVSQACRIMGVSRDTFYRVKEAKDTAAWRRCYTRTGADRTLRTGWMSRSSRRSWSLGWRIQPRARFESPTSCASAIST